MENHKVSDLGHDDRLTETDAVTEDGRLVEHDSLLGKDKWEPLMEKNWKYFDCFKGNFGKLQRDTVDITGTWTEHLILAWSELIMQPSLKGENYSKYMCAAICFLFPKCSWYNSVLFAFRTATSEHSGFLCTKWKSERFSGHHKLRVFTFLSILWQTFKCEYSLSDKARTRVMVQLPCHGGGGGVVSILHTLFLHLTLL